MGGESSPNFYDLLHVARDAPTDDIRAAYRRLARLHHPDHGGAGTDAMAQINQAYETLSDPERRARYDHGLATRPPPRQPGRVVLPADRARRRMLWAASAVALVAMVVGLALLGLSSMDEVVLPVRAVQPQNQPQSAHSQQAAQAQPPAPRAPAAAEDGIQLIPARSIELRPGGNRASPAR